MPGSELPQGHYLSCVLQAAPDAGGQTRALLMRNRILAREGIRPEVLTLGSANDHHQRREILLERGLLLEPIGYRNIYEHYLEHGWGDRPAGAGEPLEDISRHRTDEHLRPDGSPWRATYRLPDTRLPIYDFLRPDGTPYLRIPGFGLSRGGRGRGRIQQVGPDGLVVGEFKSAAQWFRRWIREVTRGDEQAFVFIDSRWVVPHVVPMRTRRIHLIYVLHNIHLMPPYRWDSQTNKAYRRVLRRMDGLNALVTLTERQREDLRERHGRTNNLFVVPNPVELPDPPPGPPPRDRDRVAIVARLEGQKRLDEAIAAFELVVRAVPSARLEIYGEGGLREQLQAQVDAAGLGGSVTLRGFDPHAQDTLWTSSAFVMTSDFEGYPLSTLESMSRGCPVVSYDIKYGPHEQIADGVDGFLVPPGDRDALARRVVELLRSPELVERMSAAARASAGRFGPREFVDAWAGVLQSVVEQRPRRTQLASVSLELSRLRRRRLDRLQLAGSVRVKGRRRTPLKAVDLSLAAIDEASGAVTELPLEVERADGALQIRTPRGLRAARVPAGTRLRLRLTWRNSAWETDLQLTPEAP